MTISPVPTLTLRNDVTIPALGMGTWPMDDTEVAGAVETAIGIGYRLLDTAENYRNEEGVGEGLRRSGIDRGEVFLTTKFNERWHSYDGARAAFENSATKLGVDYIDLLMIHWPRPAVGGFVAAMRGLAALREDGLIRAVGASNFAPAHLRAAIDAGVVPEVNQIRRDPYNPRRSELAFHADHGIVTESYSPIGRAGELLADPVITEIARAHGRTAAQVVLRWHTQTGALPIPKSADAGRLAENFAIFDFELTGEDLDRIAGLDAGDPHVPDVEVAGH
ncbi:aldo/keto reductase [Ruania zhangjianzhongii]|uniref:aldo/keto reductase n=1 Tax=Ruania zhangjianzhongii TaxID=2603206 RepID=UPI0011CA56A3|nr:aldo/keto reductase [Ruania zhangjianzhongii]